MIKKVWSLLFSIILLFPLSACGKVDKRVYIKFSSWGSESEVAVLKPLLKDFEKQNPDIKVEFIHIPKNYFQKLHLLVASNLTPDVIFINNFSGPMYAQSNVFEDLTPYIKNEKKAFFDNALNAFTYKKQFYALPRDISNLVVYYDKDLFDKFGIPYPSENWNYNDFLKTAQKLTKDTNNDGKTDIFGFGFEDNSLFWLPFIWSNGGGIISPDLQKITLDKPESIKSLQFYSDLRNKYHVSPTAAQQGSTTTAQMFMQGRVAMHISGRWNVPRYRDDIKFNWDIARFPFGEKGSIVDVDVSGWAISKDSKHKEQAWKLIKFLSSKNSIGKFTQDGLIVPARADVAYSQTFLDKTQKPRSAKIFIDVIKDGIPTPANKNYQQILDVVDSSLESLWNGEKTAQQAVDKPTLDRLNKLLK